MPDFHPDIKDLIYKMMTVDPNERITMQGIKSHPAFRFMLAPTYIVPTPIPFPDFSNPIDPAMLSNSSVLKSLEEIGIDNEEACRALMSTDNNVVKVFVMMLSQKIEITELPWDMAVANVEAIDSAPALEGFGTGTVDQSNLYEPKPRFIPEVSSPEGFSFAQRSNWIQLDSVTTYEYDETFGPATMSLAAMMSLLQQILIQNNFNFFHPNDLSLLGKNEKDNYIQLDAVFVSSDSIALHTQMKNMPDDLRDLITGQINEMLS